MPKWHSLDWVPDLDVSWEVAPGALKVCRGFYPTRRGSYMSWDMEDVQASYTSTTEPQIAGITRKNDGTARFFLFNKQSIFEFTSTTAATDRSSTTYSASTTTWTWAQFGDTTIATNLYNNPQASASGAFADLGGSPPKAQLIAVALGQVMLANYNDGTAYPAGWYCCDYDDATDWTVTATNGADYGNLYDTPGPIRALETLRDGFVAYKDDSIYLAEFVGDPNSTIWAWRLVSDKVGCSSAHGVAKHNDKHYFMHRSGFYEFDGAAVRLISRKVSNYLFNGITEADPATCQATADQKEGVIIFCWEGPLAGKKDVQAFYNVETGKWSYNLGQTFTAGSFATYYPTAVVKCTQADMIAFDATVTSSTSSFVMVGKADTKITAYIAYYPAAGTASHLMNIRIGTIGNADDGVTLDAIKPRLLHWAAGTTPTANFIADNTEMNVSYDSSALETPDTTNAAAWESTLLRFNGKVSGKYITADMVFTGNEIDIAGIFVDAKMSGKR
jgi:hypothetical protein